jgi:membrane-bound ClpP family serine protease
VVGFVHLFDLATHSVVDTDAVVIKLVGYLAIAIALMGAGIVSNGYTSHFLMVVGAVMIIPAFTLIFKNPESFSALGAVILVFAALIGLAVYINRKEANHAE